jgi:acyl-CoA hydrolase
MLARFFSGGGWNSSMNVGFINLGSPVANGSTVSVRLRLGVMATGRFSFLVNVEALP